jgi:hypothetical protein
MEIVIEKSTGTKSAWSELEHFVLKREKQWQSDEEMPEFAGYEYELHERLMKLERELLGAELKRYDLAVKEIEVGGSGIATLCRRAKTTCRLRGRCG